MADKKNVHVGKRKFRGLSNTNPYIFGDFGDLKRSFKWREREGLGTGAYAAASEASARNFGSDECRSASAN